MRRKRVFFGSYYIRGGKTFDKHGNVYKKPITYRQTRTGFVVNPPRKFIGIEKPYKHHYSSDPKKIRKPSTFVRPNSFTALKRRRSHIRRLR